jgi:hypothetical protein
MAGVVIVIAVVAASCSSGGGKTNDTAKNDNVKKDWDPAVVAQLKELAGKISTHLPNQCIKVTVVPAAAERTGIEHIGGKVEPAAMVDCDVLGENEEVAGSPTPRPATSGSMSASSCSARCRREGRSDFLGSTGCRAEPGRF